MIIKLPLLIILICVSIFTTAQKVPDGIYRVYDLSILSVDGRVIKYSHRFLEDVSNEPDHVIIDTTDYVPLKLKSAPDTMSTMIGKPDTRLLMITLTDEATKKMEEFTERNIDKRVAIVIGGEAVTIHKIRERIIGGKLQITRCTDNACDFLFLELQDNVVQE